MISGHSYFNYAQTIPLEIQAAFDFRPSNLQCISSLRLARKRATLQKTFPFVAITEKVSIGNLKGVMEELENYHAPESTYERLVNLLCRTEIGTAATPHQES